MLLFAWRQAPKIDITIIAVKGTEKRIHFIVLIFYDKAYFNKGSFDKIRKGIRDGKNKSRFYNGRGPE